MTNFWLCFVPLFVAVDAIGVLPIFMNLTEGFNHSKRRRIIVQSIITATIVTLVFLAIGKSLFKMLGITVADFMVAGGMLLFIISIIDIITGEKKQRGIDQESLGAVPIGVPLIVGPAVLTTILLLVGEYGRYTHRLCRYGEYFNRRLRILAIRFYLPNSWKIRYKDYFKISQSSSCRNSSNDSKKRGNHVYYNWCNTP